MNNPVHTDYVTDISHAEDEPYLKRPLFNVNMRLFRPSHAYHNLVQAACDHLEWCCLTKAQGYKLPHGFSGANAGIPWNIIAIARERGTKKAWAEIMINPEITVQSPQMVESESNCGSIRLREPIKVMRREWVKVLWYDRNERMHLADYRREDGGFTIQHEIDHNRGILITDRAKITT